MGLRDRLGRLERFAQSQSETVEEAISRETLRRTTDDELRAYADALRRMREGEEPAPGDAASLARVQELREEVMGGDQAAPR